MKNMMKLLIVLGLFMGSLSIFAEEAEEAAAPSSVIGEQGTDCVQINTQTIEDDAVVEEVKLDSNGKPISLQ